MRGHGVVFVLLLSGCLKTTADLPLLSEANVDVDAPTAELVARPTEPTTLFGRLFGGSGPADDESVPEEPLEDVSEEQETREDVVAPVDDTMVAEQDVPQRRGLFGLFRRSSEVDTTDVDQPEQETTEQVTPEETTDPNNELALLTVVAPRDDRQGVEDETPRRGLAALFAPRTSMAPNPVDEPDAGLQFGSVGRICGLRGAALGQQVDRYPDSRRGYQLFDTEPGSIEPRVFHITGFDDGCARRIYGALALLGSPAVHEAVRYSQAQSEVPYSIVDEAYENVRRATCRIRQGQGCPEARMAGLQRSTGFVRLYGHFGQSDRWMEMLLSDGEVVAYGVVTR